jgi:hypothetical protein
MLPPSYLILLEISPIPFPFQADSVRINAERKGRKASIKCDLGRLALCQTVIFLCGIFETDVL